MEYLRNKKAGLNYTLEGTIETGIQLLGTEVKSVKAQHGSLSGSHVTIINGELVLLGAHIPPWQEKNAPATYDSYRTRTLLVKKKELLELAKILKTKGLTIVPISLYNKGSLIKLSVAVAKGKKTADKRNTLREKADRRDINRAIKEIR